MTDPSIKTSTFSASTPEYSAFYSNYTVNDTDYLSVSLLLTNYDASWITDADGSDGLWLGIGFGNTEMSLTNVVVCSIYFNSSDDTTFTCENGYNGEDHAAPTFLNSTSDISDIVTIMANMTTDTDTYSAF